MNEESGNNVSSAKMPSIAMAYPGDLETRTGGYRYDRRVAIELEKLGCDVTRVSLPSGFPFPSGDDLRETRDRLWAVSDRSVMLVDGLAFGAMPELAAELARRQRVIALVHHPLGYESGLTEVESVRLLNSEKRALTAADHVVVTSPATATALIDEFSVSPRRITVAVPGTDIRPLASGSDLPGLQLLNVGSLTPRKDQITLVRALARLSGLPWRLTIAGSGDFAPQTARDLRLETARYGLERRIQLAGELAGDTLAFAYKTADIFVSSSIYEGYGMAIMDAIASGLPIVATRGGAVETVVPRNAAIMVPSGDPAALADALENLMRDQNLRQRLKAAAVSARQHLPRWDDAARLIAKAALQ